MKVGEAMARALIDEGVDAVFSLLGDGSFRIVYHLARAGVPVYEGRHEAYVYAMADGYSRATGRPTVCAITGGPALGHTFTAMTSAARSGSPVVLLTGPSSRDDLRGRQQLDHRAMTELTGALYVPVHGAGVAVDRVHEVMDLVRSQGLPAVLDVPEVVQDAELERALVSRPTPAWTTPQRPHPDPEAVEAALELIEVAERPVILAGAGAVASGARDVLVRLGQATGAVMATALNARGLFQGEPFDAGVSGGYSTRAAREVLRQADLVMSFGASMDRFTTMDGGLYPHARFLQVDVRPPGPMRSGASSDRYVQGDAAVVASAILAALADRPPRTGLRTAEVARRLTAADDLTPVDLEPGRVDPRELCARLDDLLPPSCGWVSGNSGHFWAFPIMHMRRWRQPMLFAGSFGAIGYGVPVGLGAALATPDDPLVVFEGDAGAVMHMQVIETAALLGAHMLVVVLNDGVLGAEYHSMVAEGYDPALSFTPDLDLAGLARHLGARGATLTDVEDLPGLVEEFAAGTGPMLIDARVSRRVVSEPARRSTYHLED